MSIQEERELSQRLGNLLGWIEPHAAPFESVVRQGRGIKRRRQAAVAGGLAVIAAGAVLGPTVLRSELAAPPAAAQTRHYTVTVSPPAKGARPGVIAAGSINGWHWQATLSGTGDNVGVTFGQDFPLMSLGKPALAGEFAEFEAEGDGASRYGYVGPVAAATRYLTVTLADGEVLTLHPQPWAGYRYVAMVLPEKMRVLRAVAYGAAGVLGYAIPFNFGDSATFQTWLRPGQTGPARATARIGSGGSGHSRWAATAYVGPWGLCGEVYDPGADGPGGFCQPVDGRLQFGLVTGQFGSGPGGVEVGLARQDVAYLLVTTSVGSVVRVPVVHVPGYPNGLTAMIRPGHPAFTSWVAYGASGNRLGRGNGDPVGFR